MRYVSGLIKAIGRRKRVNQKMITDNPKFRAFQQEFGHTCRHYDELTQTLMQSALLQGADKAEELIASDAMAIEFAEWVMKNFVRKYAGYIYNYEHAGSRERTIQKLLEIFKKQHDQTKT